MEDVFASAYCTVAATSARDSSDGFLNGIQGTATAKCETLLAGFYMSAIVWTILLMTWIRHCSTVVRGYYKKEPYHVGQSISVQIRHTGNVAKEYTAKTLRDWRG